MRKSTEREYGNTKYYYINADLVAPRIITTAYSITKPQQGYGKLDTGLSNNHNINSININIQTKSLIKRKINLPKRITTIGTRNIRTLQGIEKYKN